MGKGKWLQLASLGLYTLPAHQRCGCIPSDAGEREKKTHGNELVPTWLGASRSAILKACSLSWWALSLSPVGFFGGSLLSGVPLNLVVTRPYQVVPCGFSCSPRASKGAPPAAFCRAPLGSPGSHMGQDLGHPQVALCFSVGMSGMSSPHCSSRGPI